MCLRSAIQRGLIKAKTLTFKSLLLLILITFLSACDEESVIDGNDDQGDTTDTTPPEISLLGANPFQIGISSGDTFADPGATATDNVDGDISANIVVGGDTVDTSTQGAYVLTYDVSDAAGNAASQVTRTVVVSEDTPVEAADTTPPVITLLGENPLAIDISSGEPFSDPGATATDNVDGNISANIVVGGDTVDTSTLGSYVLTYNVSDAAGNAASQVTRSVVVSDAAADTTSPEITLLGANPLEIDTSSSEPFSDPGATATDDVDGDISANIVVGGDTVDTSTEGTYFLTYDVSDAAGNAATRVTRTVVVGDGTADTTPPEITLLGDNPFEIDVSSGEPYTDPGATATDDVDGDISASIVIGGDTVDNSTPGTYLVTYDVSDAAGNAASQVARTVVVIDRSRLIISEDFELFTAYDPNENGFYWKIDNNTGTVSDPDNASNTVMSFEFEGNPDLGGDAQAQQGFGIGANQQELWFSYRLFVPENYHHRDATSSDNNKAFFTIWGGNYTGSNVHSRTEFWPQDDGTSVFSFAYKRHNQTYTTHYFSDSDGRTRVVGIEAADYGQWMDVVVQIKVSDKGATNGVFNIWKNGALLASWRDLDNSSADGIDDNEYTDGYLLGWANSGFAETTTFYMDDFMLGTTAESIGFMIP
jgi:hypothetical protein